MKSLARRHKARRRASPSFAAESERHATLGVGDLDTGRPWDGLKPMGAAFNHPTTKRPADLPDHVDRSLRSGGQPLDRETRARMESHFGYDLSRVRVHADDQASQSAARLWAYAYTVGPDIVFGPRQFQPRTSGGRELLTHELTHVVQQAQTGVTRIQPKMVVKGLTYSPAPGSPPAVRKATKVEADEVRTYIQKMCPDFNVDAGSHAVQPKSGAFCAKKPSRLNCQCLCDMHGLKETWQIRVSDMEWPQTDYADKWVRVPSMRKTDVVQMGAWGKSGTPGAVGGSEKFIYDNPRILAHELCGHAWLSEFGSAKQKAYKPAGPHDDPAAGRPGHDPTVRRENELAKEIEGPTTWKRGLYHSDPHHGESFARIIVGGFGFGKTSVTSLTGTGPRNRDAVVYYMNQNPSVKAEIIGHADQPGSESVNKTVSRQRAENMKSWLRPRVVRPSRLLPVIAKGESQCPLPGEQPSCRKVEVFMFGRTGASERYRKPGP